MGCEDIKSILESPHFQANASFSHLRQILDKYTENEHRETPEGLRTLWEKYTLDFLHPYREHLNSNFDEVPNTENNSYLKNLVGDLSVNRIKDELKKFYTTLVMLETRVKKIVEYQEEHKEVLIHKLTREQYDNVTDFFSKVIINIHRDVEECRYAMHKFDMEEPTNSEEAAAFNGNKVDSWLIIQEYLRFTHFLTIAYDIMKGCAC